MANCFALYKRFMSTSRPSLSNVFNHVTIVGGGLMGSGIAQVTAQSGIDVTIIEVNEEAVKKSDANIKNSIQRVAKKLFQNSSEDAERYIAESMGRLKISLDLNETVAKTDLVVEAIVENLGAKHKLFSRIDSVAPEHTIFASNTSSLSITDIAAVTKRKDRFAGLHFFNPVPVMKLLEVIKTDNTSEETYQKMMAWGKAIGKTTITCKDTPGFVVNRLLIPYLAEAARMLERGDATAKDIDTAMKLGAGYPMGPLELLDYVGLDTTKFILDGWHSKYPDNPAFSPIPILQKLVSEGKLGKKTGEGFYSYKKNAGAVSFIHSPYFQPLPSSNIENGPSADGSHPPTPPQPNANANANAPSSNPVQPQSDNTPKQPPKQTSKEQKGKTGKFAGKLPKTTVMMMMSARNLAKIERLEKYKKVENLKRNPVREKVAKSEREKVKRSGRPKKGRPFESCVLRGGSRLVKSERSKNLEDFIKFEREKDFPKVFHT